jgi:hypothetical protein
MDEVALWRSDSSANPDTEVWRAIRPAMASFGRESLAITASSPYARKGLLYDGWKRYYDKSDSRNLVWQAPSWICNPTIPDDNLREAFEEDPVSYRAEYGATFRSDVESFVSQDVVEGATMPGVFEIAPQSGVQYCAFVDAAGGSSSGDSMTMAIAFKQGDKTVLAAIRERRPPFSPDDVAAEFATLMKSYNIYRATSDKWGSGYVVESMRKHGITLEQTAKSKSDLYSELLPTLNSGKARLLDNARLASQLCGLERKTARWPRLDRPRPE